MVAVATDVYANRSRAGQRMTRFYDARGENRFDAHKTPIDEQPYKRPAPTGDGYGQIRH